jgi:hypothetical protein
MLSSRSESLRGSFRSFSTAGSLSPSGSRLGCRIAKSLASGGTTRKKKEKPAKRREASRASGLREIVRSATFNAAAYTVSLCATIIDGGWLEQVQIHPRHFPNTGSHAQ